MNAIRTGAALLAAAWLAGVADAPAVEFFVALTGSDTGSGSFSHPFASLPRAQRAARQYRAKHPGETVTITLASGTYELPEPLVFRPADSGESAAKPVLYRSAHGAEVVISGGQRIRGWEQDPAHQELWRAPVLPGTTLNQLWVNGSRAIRARYPNAGRFLELAGVEESPGNAEGVMAHRFRGKGQDLEVLKSIRTEQLADVEVLVFHKWDTTRERIKNSTPVDDTFSTEGRKMNAWNRMDAGSLYFLENMREALDSPGEWFQDKAAGWIYYWPRAGEDMRRAEAVVPRLESLLVFSGEATNTAPQVRNITFEGLKFRHTSLPVPDIGLPPFQAAINVSSTAILLDGAEHIRFQQCAVEHTGGTGFWFRKACRRCEVGTTRLYDLGAGGVRIGETELVPEPVRTGSICISNCIIQTGGRMLPHAVGVWIGHSADNVIAHCDVGDFYYTAVSVGWRWGYAESGAKRNRLEYNHLHHLGYRVLSDMGGVYTLGPSEGTVVRNNIIHDVFSTRYGGWGLYTDEGSTGIVFANNLVYDVQDGCVHQHYGRENVFTNNILAFSREGQVAITRAEPHLSLTFARNIVYWDAGTLLGYGGWKAGARVELSKNLYWRAGGQPFDFAGSTWEQWQAQGKDVGSLIADPVFQNANTRDFRLKKGSPALRLGFQPFDPQEAGVQGKAWRKLALERSYPPLYQP